MCVCVRVRVCMYLCVRVCACWHVCVCARLSVCDATYLASTRCIRRTRAQGSCSGTPLSQPDLHESGNHGAPIRGSTETKQATEAAAKVHKYNTQAEPSNVCKTSKCRYARPATALHPIAKHSKQQPMCTHSNSV